MTHPAIACQAKPADHREQPESDDVHHLGSAQRLLSTGEPAPQAEQPEEQGESEHAGTREPHQRDQHVQPAESSSHDAPQREEEPEQTERLRIAHLEQRGHGSRGEEGDRPHRRGGIHSLSQHAVQDDGCRVPGRERDQQRPDHPLPAERQRHELRQIGVHRHERPLILRDGPGVGQRQMRRVAVHGHEPVPLGVPSQDQVADPGLGSEPRPEPRKVRRNQHEGRRDDAGAEVDDRDARRHGKPGPGAALGRRVDQRPVSHARRPCSTASICASGTRSSSWWARRGSPGP